MVFQIYSKIIASETVVCNIEPCTILVGLYPLRCIINKPKVRQFIFTSSNLVNKPFHMYGKVNKILMVINRSVLIEKLDERTLSKK